MHTVFPTALHGVSAEWIIHSALLQKLNRIDGQGAVPASEDIKHASNTFAPTYGLRNFPIGLDPV